MLPGVQAAVKQIQGLTEKIDLLINNAGLNPNNGTWKLSEE
jgi:NADP-dependent 3-hydroxy acid dehydrogenase YdfG